MEDKIVDLDVIKPSKTIVKISDKEIDVSIISFERILDIIEKIDVFDENKPGYTKIILGAFSNVMKSILKDADKTITDEWLNKNIDSKRMLTMINEIIIPMVQEMSNDIGISAKTKTESKKN